MFLIQDICLSWNKKERGPACSRKRAEFPQAYTLDKLPEMFYGDVIVQRLRFLQKDIMFQSLHVNEAYYFQAYTSVGDVNLTNLSIQSDADSYDVTFFYDERRSGKPFRSGHNKDYNNIDSLLYRHNILNETAFSLRSGQYGRILWNERNIDYDTGEWYYQLHIYNLLYYPGKIPKQNIFLNSRLDFEYKQIAELY